MAGPSFVNDRAVPSMLENVMSVGATAPIAQTNIHMLTSYTNFGHWSLT